MPMGLLGFDPKTAHPLRQPLPIFWLGKIYFYAYTFHVAALKEKIYADE